VIDGDADPGDDTRTMAPSAPSGALTIVDDAPSGTGPGSLTTGLDNQREAMLLDEARRTRLFGVLVVVAATAAALALPALDGSRDAKIAHAITLVVTAIAGAAIAMWLRELGRFRSWVVSVFALITGISLLSAALFWGVYSSAMIFPPLAVYYFAAGESRWPALVVFGSCCVPQGVIGYLIAAGVFADPGLIRPLDLRPLAQIVAITLAQVGLVITYVMARRFRRSVTVAIGQVEVATRALAKREALLDEVRHELARARQIGGGGLFSGQVLGSFQLGVILGRGAMGEVYEARHVTTGEPAAVKILAPTATGSPELVQRFLREVEIASALRAPNVVTVLEAPDRSAPLPYLAMERLHGESLATILRHTPRFELGRAVELVRGLAAGLAAAHAAGIVHRDLKPHNVYLHTGAGGPIWKILDFGISKLLGQELSLTTNHLVGTPAYMAPEQVRGTEIDRRVDVHALGVLTYRILTGRPAFSGRDLSSILYSIAHEMPPRPGEMAPLPGAVDQVLAIALAKDPVDRFDSAPELAAALAEAADGRISPALARRADRVLASQPWDE
jgi:eukaryotic-like serine/threonine-protein kinase